MRSAHSSCDAAYEGIVKRRWITATKKVGPKARVIKAGCIYLIRADNDLYKIGSTVVSVEKRFKGLQRANACTLELLESIETDDAAGLELALHELFAKVWHHGEWFVLDEEAVDFILDLDEPVIRALIVALEETRTLNWQHRQETQLEKLSKLRELRRNSPYA